MLRSPSRRAGLIVAIASFLVAPLGLAGLALPDAAPPAGLDRPIHDFSDVIRRQFDLLPLSHTRYVGIETGPDGLVVLFFEIRGYPYLAPGREVWLASRCEPLGTLDPMGMSGGTVMGSRSDDPELVYLRSDAQPTCPSGG